MDTDGSSKPPAEVIEERTRAITAPRSLTAAIMGDPLPGRSALDGIHNRAVPR